MRPDVLTPLFATASNLSGIGPKTVKLLGKLLRPVQAATGQVDARIVDLVMHAPTGLIDRRMRPAIAALPPDGIVSVDVEIGSHRPPPPHNRRLPYRVSCFDDTGSLTLVFFHAHGDYLRRLLPEGERRYVSGRIEWFQDMPQMAHPDHVLTAEEFSAMPPVEPVYPLTTGLSAKMLAKAIRAALDELPALPEWQDPAWLRKNASPDFTKALKTLHHPETEADLAADSPARLRLAYDELLANQLALSLVRRRMRQTGNKQPLSADGRLRDVVVNALDWSLTDGQRAALGDIVTDMASSERMLRLLQGDVGSGKTIVAFLALLAAVEAGGQGALMVPTDLLARQHLASLQPLADAAGINLGLLTGREKGKVREVLLADLASGKTDIVIGTHALFQAGVAMHALSLTVIDEQHRFGVHQRLALQAKAGRASDLLVMTATPIPRTLALTVYGDMEVSRLTEKPAGRQPVTTSVLPLERLEEVVSRLDTAARRGVRAYWVCPLVEESEQLDAIAAEDRFAMLLARLDCRVGLVHGRMQGAEKDATMQAFKSGDLSVLVSTTVIEVGMDVPEATIMVIENAERFGLAQLHQLRGRVGRGRDKSACLLMYGTPLSETAQARLKIMRETEDGFRIAEEDMRLRGAGEVLGTRQSGIPVFRLASLSDHGDLLAAARDDAELVLRDDPDLTSRRGEALRHLLYLFERDEAMRLISAG